MVEGNVGVKNKPTFFFEQLDSQGVLLLRRMSLGTSRFIRWGGQTSRIQ